MRFVAPGPAHRVVELGHARSGKVPTAVLTVPAVEPLRGAEPVRLVVELEGHEGLDLNWLATWSQKVIEPGLSAIT